MAGRPIVSQVAEELYEDLKPLAYKDALYSYALLKMCEAIIGPIQEIRDLYQGNKQITQDIGNWILNPSMENNLTDVGYFNYVNSSLTTVRTNEDARHGSYSLKMTMSASGGELFEGVEWRTPNTLTPGTYIARASIKRTQAKVISLGTGGMPGTSATYTEITVAANDPGVGQWIEYETYPMVVTTGGQFMVWVRKLNIAQDDVVYADRISLVRSDNPDLPSYYVDGDVEGAHWEGTAGNSRTLWDIITYGDPVEPNWGNMLDVETAPAEVLPWLAQFVGARAPTQLPGETDANYEQRVRDYIASTPGFYRGSVGAITAEIQKYLTGAKTVFFRERDTSAYHYTVNVKESETPPADWASTNLNTNGSFETNLTSWGNSDAGVASMTVTRSGEQYYHGSWSLKFVNTATNENDFVFNTSITCVPGVKYTFSGRYKVTSYTGPPVNNYGPRLVFSVGGTGTVPVEGDIFATITGVTNDWVYFSLTGTSPAGTTASYLRLYGPQGTVYYDQLQFEEQSAATPYIHTDGSTASRPVGQGPVGHALQISKPGGLVAVLGVITGWDYAALDAGYASYTALDAAFTTYADLEEGP